ncbi:MAG: exodeoxyribonuclease III [Rhodospirillaceae bacterium]
MRIATWNVNSLKIRLPHLLQWLASHQPDVMCLQETKLEDAAFPRDDIAAAGYQVLCCGQKTYNGVAILSRQPASDVVDALPDFDTTHKRLLAATIAGVRYVCVYVPNGESPTSDKYPFKLGWLSALRDWLKAELGRHPRLAVLGDFNIAPEERDVHDPALWAGRIHFTEPEKAALRELYALGLKDSFRLFEQPPGSYTWWDYRMNAFRRKMGLRIDHILVSPALAASCKACTVDVEPRRLERPSDHAPVFADFSAA